MQCYAQELEKAGDLVEVLARFYGVSYDLYRGTADILQKDTGSDESYRTICTKLGNLILKAEKATPEIRNEKTEVGEMLRCHGASNSALGKVYYHNCLVERIPKSNPAWIIHERPYSVNDHRVRELIKLEQQIVKEGRLSAKDMDNYILERFESHGRGGVFLAKEKARAETVKSVAIGVATLACAATFLLTAFSGDSASGAVPDVRVTSQKSLNSSENVVLPTALDIVTVPNPSHQRPSSQRSSVLVR